MVNQTDAQKVAAFLDNFSLDAPIEARVMDLASEVGELAKEVLLSTSYGQKEFQPAPEWHHEMGDVYFVLLCLALKTDTDLEAELENALKRYEDRVREKGMAGNPDH